MRYLKVSLTSFFIAFRAACEFSYLNFLYKTIFFVFYLSTWMFLIGPRIFSPSLSPFPSFSFFFFNFYNIWNNFNLRSFNNFTGLSRYNWNRNWKTNLYCNSVAATAVAREIVSDNHNSVHEVKHHKFILKYTTLCSRF